MGILSNFTRLYGGDKQHAALLAKLDLSLLPYFSLIYFLFNLERSSYAHAYISGMKEDVGFVGKQYNYMNTCFLVGFAVFQAPFTTLLSIFPPRWVFFICNLGWAILTLISFRMNHVYQFYIINLFEGILTSGCFVGAHFVLGSWYKRSELGKRAALFVSCGDIGSMCGGWIQAGLFSNLENKGGLPAWRWIYIIVFILVVPFIIIGFLFLPDLPHHRNARFLSESQQQLAIDRLAYDNANTTKDKLNKAKLWKIVTSWQFWLMPFIFFLYGVSVQMLGNNVMPLWMASRGYGVVAENNYPTAIFAMSIVGTLGYSFISDLIKSRWQASVAIGLTFTLCCPILLSKNVADGGKFFAFYLLGTCLAPQALWFTWCSDVTSHDYYLRAVTIGWMNAIDEAFIAWWPIIFYPTTDAPYYTKGYIASLVLGTLIVPTVGVIVYLERRDKARLEAEKANRGSDEESPRVSDELPGIKTAPYAVTEVVSSS